MPTKVKKAKSKPWTETELAMFSTMKDDTIAEKTGRTLKSVVSKRGYLRHKANKKAAKKAVKKKQAEVRMAAKPAEEDILVDSVIISFNGRLITADKGTLAAIQIKDNSVRIVYEQ